MFGLALLFKHDLVVQKGNLPSIKLNRLILCQDSLVLRAELSLKEFLLFPSREVVVDNAKRIISL
jgi:hypothetical protein